MNAERVLVLLLALSGALNAALAVGITARHAGAGPDGERRAFTLQKTSTSAAFTAERIQDSHSNGPSRCGWPPSGREIARPQPLQSVQ